MYIDRRLLMCRSSVHMIWKNYFLLLVSPFLVEVIKGCPLLDFNGRVGCAFRQLSAKLSAIISTAYIGIYAIGATGTIGDSYRRYRRC